MPITPLPDEITLEITREDAINAKEYICSDCLLGTCIARNFPGLRKNVGASQVNIAGDDFRIVDLEHKIRFAYGDGTWRIPMDSFVPFTVKLVKIP